MSLKFLIKYSNTTLWLRLSREEMTSIKFEEPRTAISLLFSINRGYEARWKNLFFKVSQFAFFKRRDSRDFFPIFRLIFLIRVENNFMTLESVPVDRATRYLGESLFVELVLAPTRNLCRFFLFFRCFFFFFTHCRNVYNFIALFPLPLSWELKNCHKGVRMGTLKVTFPIHTRSSSA